MSCAVVTFRFDEAQMFIPTRNRAALGSCALLFSFCSIQGVRADEPEADSLESVVVTATRSARSINDVPESVSVVSAQAIADTPGQALDDVLQTFGLCRSTQCDVLSTPSNGGQHLDAGVGRHSCAGAARWRSHE